MSDLQKMVRTPYDNDVVLLITCNKGDVVYADYRGFIACERKEKSALRSNQNKFSRRLVVALEISMRVKFSFKHPTRLQR